MASRHRHDRQGSAGVRVFCVPLRLLCRRYGCKVIGISSNLSVFIGEQKKLAPSVPADVMGRCRFP
jgi:hypothetical protein